MKSLYKIIPFILGTAVLASCAREQDSQERAIPESGKDIIQCRISSLGDSAVSDGGEVTKLSLKGGSLPVWEEGDMVSVMSANGENNNFSLFDGAGTAVGSFLGQLPGSSTYHCLYPYQKYASISENRLSFSTERIQSCVSGNFSKGGNVMVASCSAGSPEPVFRNVFGILELQLRGTASVGSMTVTSNSDEMLWGNCILNLDGHQGTSLQTLNVSGGDNSVSIKLKRPSQLSENEAKSFYFILPASTLSHGFVLDIFDSKDNLIYTKTTSKDQTIIRSEICQMPVIDGVDRISDEDIEPQPTTWAAYNNLGRTEPSDVTDIDPQASGYPSYKDEKYVGIFYFVYRNQKVSSRSVINNQQRMGWGNYNFDDSKDYGPENCVNFWGKPYLDYYSEKDTWVIRKHAQMLSDAGVDFIAFDVTNNEFYPTDITLLLNTFKDIRDKGGKTPQVTFMIWHSGVQDPNTPGVPTYDKFNHDRAVQYLYNTFYTNSDYAELWFKWEDKPLMLANGAHVTNAGIRNYFTFRQSWYLWNTHAQTPDDMGEPWWHKGWDKSKPIDPEDKWPWGVCYTDDAANPMKAGTHNGKNEFCSVSAATHPVSNIGRSYPVNQNIDYNSGVNSYTKQPARGIYFKSQFSAAMALDPQVMFFTGWNEWLMGNYKPPTNLNFWYVGGVKAATHLFVDQYNHEFSRDIEPLEGDFGDNYYYYMVDFIRQFKGVEPVAVFNKKFEITIDGKFADWIKVGSAYADDRNDAIHRNFPGYATGLTLSNTTGRNDLNISKIATDGTKLYFYITTTGDDIAGYYEGENGLNLLLRTSSPAAYWEGFNYRVMPTSATTAKLSRCSTSGSYSWTDIDNNIQIAVSGKAMEVAVPLSELGLNLAGNFNVDFKWVDNVDLSQSDGIQRCMRDGDSAPNGRFRYRYVFNN